MAALPRPARPRRQARVSVVAAGGLLVVLLQVAFFLVLANGDVSRLVHAAPPHTDPRRAPSSLDVGPEGTGFDGQFFYRQAQAPLSSASQVGGVRFDLPALRSARVGYPLLARLLSAGRPAVLPYSLVAVNVVAGTVLVAAVAAIARDAGTDPAWGLVAGAYPGFVYTLGFDLAELTAVSLLAAGMVAARRRRWSLVALAWSAAVLTRETTAVLPLAAVAVHLARAVRRRSTDPGLAVAATVSLAVAGAWQLLLLDVFGHVPVLSSGEKNVGMPLGGLLNAAAGFVPTTAAGAFRLASLATLVVIIGTGAACWRSSRAWAAEKLAFVLAVAMVTSLSPFVWAGATSFMRAASELSLLAVVLAATASCPVRLLLPVVFPAVTAVTLASQVVKA